MATLSLWLSRDAQTPDVANAAVPHGDPSAGHRGCGLPRCSLSAQFGTLVCALTMSVVLERQVSSRCERPETTCGSGAEDDLCLRDFGDEPVLLIFDSGLDDDYGSADVQGSRHRLDVTRAYGPEEVGL